MALKRLGVKANLSQAVVRGDTVYLSGQIARKGESVRDQTIDILEQIDDLLAEVGSDKSNLLSANIWLVDIATFSEMNDVWNDWVAPGRRPHVRRSRQPLRHPSSSSRSWPSPRSSERPVMARRARVGFERA